MRAGSHIPRAGARHHAALLFATAGLMLSPSAGLRAQQAEAPAESAAPAAAPAPAPSFSQRGVPAEATAENGVVAREQALAAGRRSAWERLAAGFGIRGNPSDAQLERMIDSIVIEQERTSPTRYSGRITVNFNPGRVRASYGSGIGASPGGGSGGGGGAPAEGEARIASPGPVSSSVEAVARYGSLQEWLELRRRLAGSGARLDVLAISTDRARLRLGLRQPPEVASQDMQRNGIALGPGVPGEAWRVGLAGGN